ncbi:PRC-barrel domain-containing protein [Metabacillus fastidiosus]|uniref:PRC-barrel domain-containing protein n=1 Tax=Metabacillus fastidiosus TaxID=1458 RepID=UPI003D283E48
MFEEGGGLSLRTFKTVKGLPIYDQKTAKLIGTVEDLCFSPKGFVIGLMMDGKGLFKRDRFIPIDVIQALGDDGVMIQSEEQLLTCQEMKSCYEFETYDQLRFKAVFTETGDKIGLLDDVYFSPQMGRIEAYELTDGFFADLAEGKKVVKATGQPLVISKDAIVMEFEP